MQQWYRLAGRCLVVLLAAALACGLAEIALRVLYFQRHAGVPLALMRSAVPLYERLVARAKPPVGIWRWDSEIGYDHIPNSSGLHRSARGDFSVRYTIDDLGCRQNPLPLLPRGEVLFIGDSVTFGFGVEDSQSFPCLLARNAWRDVAVRNRAVQGWGTAHGYLAMRRWLTRRAAPDLVLYVMIPHHLQRNYLRASWLDEVLSWCPPGERRGHPHFEWEGGELSYRGVVGPEAGVSDSLALRNKEVAITCALLTAMNNETRRRNVPLVVILLPGPGRDYPPAVIQTLIGQGIRYLDLTPLDLPSFANDPHFNAEGQSRIAASIAGSFVGDLVRSIGDRSERRTAPRQWEKASAATQTPEYPADTANHAGRMTDQSGHHRPGN
ncbi:MAG: SGNH/GDSL hydrolase family protein [bacterium]